MTNTEPTVIIDIERMDKALNSETIYPPQGMTREQTRQFIIDMGKETPDANCPSN